MESIDLSALLNTGVAGAVLVWLATRVERKLDRVLEVSVLSARAMTVLALSQNGGRVASRQEAEGIRDELDAISREQKR
jgi:hypothetical protein